MEFINKIFEYIKYASDWVLSTFKSIESSDDIYLLAIYVVFIVFFTLVARIIQNNIFNKLLAKLEKTKSIWDDAIIYSLHKPVGALIWLIGIIYAANVLALRVLPVIKVGVIFVIAWSLIRLINRLEKTFIDPRKVKKPIDRETTNLIGRLFKISIIIATVLVTLQSLEYKLSGVLALGSVGTLVIGMAAKDLMANFFGGLMLFLDKPFRIGDWIRSPDREIEGTVEFIGWRLTRIRTFSKRALYVPNSVFSNISIENPSRMTNRQIKEMIGLRYQDATKLPLILSDIENMLKSHPDLDTNVTTFIQFSKFSESSLDCQLYCFTKTTKWVEYLKIQQDVFLKIIEIVRGHGGDVAFPTRTLDMPENLKLERTN